MKFIETLKLAVAAIWAHKLRSALTLLGMIIGVAAVVAMEAGWVVTESGRQPWLVQGLLRTADATSPVLAGASGTRFADRSRVWC